MDTPPLTGDKSTSHDMDTKDITSQRRQALPVYDPDKESISVALVTDSGHRQHGDPASQAHLIQEIRGSLADHPLQLHNNNAGMVKKKSHS